MRFRAIIERIWSPAPALDALPARVVAAIDSHRHRGEILVKTVQIALISLLAVLYLAAPKNYPDGWALAPYVISVYLAVNLALLIRACRRPLPDRLVYASAVFDVLLLYILIWSYHLQYMQPASFVLKSPTLLHVFVLIAVRALRFEPKFVITTGVTAAAGWALIVVYVLLSMPSETVVTRDYVTYITSNALLFGAEIDKIIAILMVTAVLAAALTLARRLLIKAVADETASVRLSRFFDAGVAAEIRTGDDDIRPGKGVARRAAILNVDVRGFSQLTATTSPDEALQLLAAYQSVVVPIIQRNGGVIDKFMGDGIMATFGAVSPSDRYAADALRAVEQTLAATRSWHRNPLLRRLDHAGIGAAVTVGPIVFGTVGQGERLEMTVIGAAVNMSAKLEKLNKSLGCRAVVAAEAFELAVEQGYRATTAPRRRQEAIDGFEQPFELCTWR